MIKSYFDVIKILGKPAYENVSTADKGRYFFMVNRHLTRMYPVIAATFSHIKVDSANAMDFWNFYFKNIYKASKNPLPSKENFAKLSQKGKVAKYNEEGIEFMVSRLKLGSAEVEILKKLKSKDLIKYLKAVDELLNEKIKK
jgi:hypothetical protein